MDLYEMFTGAWKSFCMPPRQPYSLLDLGPSLQQTKSGVRFHRFDYKLQNQRGFNLELSFYESEQHHAPTTGCVIYLHCFNGSRLECRRFAEYVISRGCNFCSFDFAGSGISEGQFVSMGHYEQDDVHSVISFLREKKQVSKIALWGRSMGAVTAMLFAAKFGSQVEGMVVDSGFVSMMEAGFEIADKRVNLPGFIVKGMLEFVRRQIKNNAGFDMEDVDPHKSISQTTNTSVSVLFVVSKEDKLLSYTNTLRLYEIYPSNNKQILYVSGDHNAQREQSALVQIAEFLTNVLKSKEQQQEQQAQSSFVLPSTPTMSMGSINYNNSHNHSSSNIKNDENNLHANGQQNIPAHHFPQKQSPQQEQDQQQYNSDITTAPSTATHNMHQTQNPMNRIPNPNDNLPEHASNMTIIRERFNRNSSNSSSNNSNNYNKNLQNYSQFFNTFSSYNLHSNLRKWEYNNNNNNQQQPQQQHHPHNASSRTQSTTDQQSNLTQTQPPNPPNSNTIPQQQQQQSRGISLSSPAQTAPPPAEPQLLTFNPNQAILNANSTPSNTISIPSDTLTLEDRFQKKEPILDNNEANLIASLGIKQDHIQQQPRSQQIKNSSNTGSLSPSSSGAFIAEKRNCNNIRSYNKASIDEDQHNIPQLSIAFNVKRWKNTQAQQGASKEINDNKEDYQGLTQSQQEQSEYLMKQERKQTFDNLQGQDCNTSQQRHQLSKGRGQVDMQMVASEQRKEADTIRFGREQFSRINWHNTNNKQGNPMLQQPLPPSQQQQQQQSDGSNNCLSARENSLEKYKQSQQQQQQQQQQQYLYSLKQTCFSPHKHLQQQQIQQPQAQQVSVLNTSNPRWIEDDEINYFVNATTPSKQQQQQQQQQLQSQQSSQAESQAKAAFIESILLNQTNSLLPNYNATTTNRPPPSSSQLTTTNNPTTTPNPPVTDQPKHPSSSLAKRSLSPPPMVFPVNSNAEHVFTFQQALLTTASAATPPSSASTSFSYHHPQLFKHRITADAALKAAGKDTNMHILNQDNKQPQLKEPKTQTIRISQSSLVPQNAANVLSANSNQLKKYNQKTHNKKNSNDFSNNNNNIGYSSDTNGRSVSSDLILVSPLRSQGRDIASSITGNRGNVKSLFPNVLTDQVVASNRDGLNQGQNGAQEGQQQQQQQLLLPQSNTKLKENRAFSGYQQSSSGSNQAGLFSSMIIRNGSVEERKDTSRSNSQNPVTQKQQQQQLQQQQSSQRYPSQTQQQLPSQSRILYKGGSRLPSELDEEHCQQVTSTISYNSIINKQSSSSISSGNLKSISKSSSYNNNNNNTHCVTNPMDKKTTPCQQQPTSKTVFESYGRLPQPRRLQSFWPHPIELTASKVETHNRQQHSIDKSELIFDVNSKKQAQNFVSKDCVATAQSCNNNINRSNNALKQIQSLASQYQSSSAASQPSPSYSLLRNYSSNNNNNCNMSGSCQDLTSPQLIKLNQDLNPQLTTTTTTFGYEHQYSKTASNFQSNNSNNTSKDRSFNRGKLQEQQQQQLDHHYNLPTQEQCLTFRTPKDIKQQDNDLTKPTALLSQSKPTLNTTHKVTTKVVSIKLADRKYLDNPTSSSGQLLVTTAGPQTPSYSSSNNRSLRDISKSSSASK